jgi:putative ubiquitin-RnfH superfamily antitoxin RatB of RatAB toxin-antitoxin module
MAPHEGDAPAPAAGPPVTGTVEVACALPDRQRVVVVPLTAAGLTARQAVERSGLLQEFPEVAAQPLALGVYGEPCEPDRPLRDGDRVELYRPLRHDPRAVRRERAAATTTRRGGRIKRP